MKSGRDQMVIDPDPDKIYTKRKKEDLYECYELHSFVITQREMLKEKIPDLEKKSRALEWRLFCFENISKNDSLYYLI